MMLIKLDKNIWKSSFQTFLSQLSAVSITTQNETFYESFFQNVFSQFLVEKNCAAFISEFIFTQISTIDSQVLMNCSQKWQTMQLHKHKKTNSKFISSNLINSQSSNKLIKILVKLKIFQNHKELNWFSILSQIITDKLNIIEFFIQNIISWVDYILLNITCIRARNKFRLHLW